MEEAERLTTSWEFSPFRAASNWHLFLVPYRILDQIVQWLIATATVRVGIGGGHMQHKIPDTRYLLKNAGRTDGL